MAPSDREEVADALATKRNTNGGNSKNTTVRFQDVPEVSDHKGQATKQECTKLVYNLSREVAVYCCLSMGIGGVSDSYVLRDELRCSASKVFDLVLLCKRKLMPLLLRRLKEDDKEDLERLYRIFVGCLEMLQAEFIRAMTLQSMFPLWDSNTLLIQTGISESVFHKKSCSSLEPSDSSGIERKMADHEEFTNLERKLTTLQEMCYTSSQMMDVHPWDYKPESDHTKIDLENVDTERLDSRLQQHSRNPRRHGPRKYICIVVLVLVVLIVVATVVGLILALTTDGQPNK